MRISTFAFWFILMAACAAATAAQLTVGPGRQFASVEQAYQRAKPGDIILVYPKPGGAAYEKTALQVRKERITFKAAAEAKEKVILSGKGYDYSGAGPVPRAIFQFDPQASGCVLDGFVLTGAHNDSHNGAGVRINQANDVTIRNCEIRGNDMGIMSNGDGTPRTAVNQLIEHCLIHSNGEPAEPGQNHNLYLGGSSVVLLDCQVRSSLTGHNVKSRAHQTVVAFCYVHDSANREFDLVDAPDTAAPDSHAVLLGNVIVKARDCAGNRGVIHFGADGGKEHDGTLYLIHNTIITPYISPVVMLSAVKAKVQFVNNIISDGGAGQHGQRLVDAGKAGPAAVSGQCNWLCAGMGRQEQLQRTYSARQGEIPPFAAPAKGDYHLARGDANIVGAGLSWDKIKLPQIVGASGEWLPKGRFGRPAAATAPATKPTPPAGGADLGAFPFPRQN